MDHRIERSEEHPDVITINMGPSHPATHGVLRVVLQLDGQDVKVSSAGFNFRDMGPGLMNAARQVVDKIYLDPKVEDYIVDIVFATREPAMYKLESLEKLIEYGASPRASIFLTTAAQAYAFLQGRGYVTPQDVKSIAPDVLRHRVLLSYEAEAEDVTPDTVIQRIFDGVPVP